MSKNHITEIKNLKKHFPVESGLVSQLLSRNQEYVKAVDGVSFSIERGETFGLVGESGCGKSTLGRTIIQLHRPTSGEVRFNGDRIESKSDSEIRVLRKEMQYIFQDPASSLNPRRRVRDILLRPLNVHDIGDSKTERHDRVEELIERVGLNVSHLDRYPHEFSGGQQQRIGIARALAVDPSFIVADEPVSALDASVQAQIINLIMDIQDEFDLTLLFIAHDLSVVKHISDRIAVMYLGDIVEQGTTKEIFDKHQHPYTNALMKAVPTTDLHESSKSSGISGEIPSPINPPSGCKFRTRCPIADEDCASSFETREFSETHSVHCRKRSPKQNANEPAK